MAWLDVLWQSVYTLLATFLMIPLIYLTYWLYCSLRLPALNSISHIIDEFQVPTDGDFAGNRNSCAGRFDASSLQTKMTNSTAFMLAGWHRDDGIPAIADLPATQVSHVLFASSAPATQNGCLPSCLPEADSVNGRNTRSHLQQTNASRRRDPG